MTNLEAPEELGSDTGDVIQHEKDLANHEITPRDRLENQIRLATDVFKMKFPELIDLDSETGRNNIMFFWTDDLEGSLSATYREIENSDEFVEHPRLLGNIYKITAEDVLFYKESGHLPKD